MSKKKFSIALFFTSYLCIQGTWQFKNKSRCCNGSRRGQISPFFEGPGHLDPFFPSCCVPSLWLENKIGCLNETLSPHRLWQLWEKDTKPKQCWLEMHKIFYYSVFFNAIRFFGQMTYYCKLHYIHRTAIAVLVWEKQRGKMLKWCFHHFLFVIRKTKVILQNYLESCRA